MCVLLSGTESVTVVIQTPLPSTANLTEAAVIIIQAPGIPNDRYVPLANALQQYTNLRLWVAVPDFPQSEPKPSAFDQAFSQIVAELQQAKLSANASIFVAGHGGGGITLQDWLVNAHHVSSLNIKGQILLGSYIQRKYLQTSYPISTLTVGGDMDGMARVSRIAESYWHRRFHPENAENEFSVIVLPGVSHMQFASGEAPALIKMRDLRPEATEEAAHEMIAVTMATFMVSRSTGAEMKYTYANVTSELLEPLIWAFTQEGYYQFKPPCYEEHTGDNCYFGSPWTARAQQIMSGLVLAKNISNLVDTDRFWPVNKIFPHDYLPQMNNQCPAPAECVLNTSTVTQNIYSKLNIDDITFDPISALQMESKLNSRQRCYEHASVKPALFNETDTDQNCAEINMASYLTAVEQAAPSTRDRFLSSGQRMTMANDKIIVVYPLWSGESLLINTTGPVATVLSPAMKFSTSNPIPLLSGLHFCKLMSPAYAMEWVYTDGLRKNHSLIQTEE